MECSSCHGDDEKEVAAIRDAGAQKSFVSKVTRPRVLLKLRNSSHLNGIGTLPEVPVQQSEGTRMKRLLARSRVY